jgi:hypothetical protein
MSVSMFIFVLNNICYVLNNVCYVVLNIVCYVLVMYATRWTLRALLRPSMLLAFSSYFTYKVS